MWTVDQYVAWALTTLVSAFIGSYLAAYLKKKGENLASKEDIKDLVKQVSAVTEATKRIEADISTGVWNKQKRWDMKREVLFEAAKRLGASDHALHHLNSVFICDKNRKPGEPEWAVQKLEAKQKWSAAVKDSDETRLFVAIVCSKEAKKTFDEFGRYTSQLVVALNTDPDAYEKAEDEVAVKLFAARAAIRIELEVDA